MPTLGDLVASPGSPTFNVWLPALGFIPSIYTGDVQTRIVDALRNENGTAQDISEATLLTFTLRSPAGVTTVNSAEFLTDGTDGYVCYTLPGGYLTAGRWQAQFEVSSGEFFFHGRNYSFVVATNL